MLKISPTSSLENLLVSVNIVEDNKINGINDEIINLFKSNPDISAK